MTVLYLILISSLIQPYKVFKTEKKKSLYIQGTQWPFARAPLYSEGVLLFFFLLGNFSAITSSEENASIYCGDGGGSSGGGVDLAYAVHWQAKFYPTDT